ncbi:MAG: protein translocase subunit SecDF [Saprospiraceae bacterium]|nr:protein translocase subunit SecDF [Saprospiraceae bacterium]
MQGKGVVKFFLILMTVVSLIQYLFIIPTRKVEKNADEYAQRAVENAGEEADTYVVEKEARTAYLDSMSSEVVLSIPLLKDYTYTDLKQQQLNLGLDLKGGMSTVLQVDLREFILNMSNNSKDPTFRLALDNASERLRNAQTDYVTLFGEEFQKVADGKRLSTIFSRNQGLRDKINYETSDGEIIRILREEADNAVDLTFKMLKDRIDKFGVTQPNVSLDANRDLILVELPGVDNPERARNFLQASAKLEFWDVYGITDPGILDAFNEADRKLDAILKGDTTAVEDTVNYTLQERYEYTRDTVTGEIIDSTLAGVDTIFTADDALAAAGPLLSDFNLNGAGGQLVYPRAVFGTADRNKIDEITEMLNHPAVRPLFPRDLEFRWSYQPIADFDTGEETDQYELYGIKARRGPNNPPLEGDHVTAASANPDPVSGQVEVILRMDQTGAKIWGDMTTKAAQDNNREVAIVLDDEVVSAPRVNQPILDGNSSISGNFSIQEAKDLANILEIGKLPTNTKIIQESLVGPSLGKENIARSMNSLIIGFLLVLVFMIIYYAGGGIVAICALFLNLFFIFGALASYGTVLTLPGIAGIVLTIGMAVDANVIIFERIREELREGKSILMSVQDGFKNSYSAIVDANVTTILTAFVLAYFGLGPIKGFAVVLIIGVLFSLFTAVLVGRLIIEWWLKRGNNIGFWTGFSKNVLANLNIDWIGKRKVTYVISSVIIIAGIVSFFTRGFELGVDFKGGYSYNIEFVEDQEVEAEALRASLETAFEGEPFIVKSIDTRNNFNITTSYLINDDSDDAADRVASKLHQGVNGVVGGDLDIDQFKSPEGDGTRITSFSKVGPTIADDIKTSSVYATVFALLLIFLYIFIRFNKWQYSLGAVAALFHDTLIVLSVFSLFHGVFPFSLEIDQAFIAALLTVIGYSINDTVVVFDRIREFFGIYTDKDQDAVINAAVNTTASRTVITSLTTLLVVLILFLFGGTSIKGFAFALVIGIVVGTYSSVFIATPVVRDLASDLRIRQSSSRRSKKSFTRRSQAEA